ncbi:MAG TPA: bifunctional precorrin-2 dehydrogenase/sirohydrochlorin ferrochelatase [Sedimentisphaerales bacterium]|nr:bifunctional precorrin-2 dehydrogenase/sirohydrochlorin ferrochelatase [Sedimentisphaerales bacterium]
MAKYPIFLELKGRRVLLVGAGAVAQRKAITFLEAGARLVVVAEKVDPNFEAMCISSKVELIIARYSEEYIRDATLVIAATNNRKVNEQIYRDCQKQQILCNSVDEPERCDFFTPAVLRRGRLQIAIGTDGACPAYAGHLRNMLEEVILDAHGRFLDELEIARSKVMQRIADEKQRKAVMGRLVEDASFEVFVKHGSAAWQKHADDAIAPA